MAFFLKLGLILTVLLPFAANATDAQYHLTWQKSRQVLLVNACFDMKQSLILDNQDRELSRALLNARQVQRDVKQRDFRIQFNPLYGKCIDYQISLNAKGRWPYLFENSSLILPTALWFWSNDQISTSRFSVKDESGNSLNFHMPWPETDGIYQTNSTNRSWTSRTLIGNLRSHTLGFKRQREINITLLGSTNKREQEWLNWLLQTANAVETAFGRLPLKQTNVLLMPANSVGKSPVPWGEVQRGGMPSVHFFINTERPIKDFEQDWTASHELSHLFVPKISWRDRWLSEGIASYYQNVLRARAGILSTEQAWKKLREGFARGRRDFNGRSMRQVNKTMHLYWGGVAIYFLADLKLREQGTSLDETLQKLSHCCLPSPQTWSAEAYMEKLDSLSDTKVFTHLLDNEARNKQFPITKSFESESNPLLIQHLKHILTHKNNTDFMQYLLVPRNQIKKAFQGYFYNNPKVHSESNIYNKWNRYKRRLTFNSGQSTFKPMNMRTSTIFLFYLILTREVCA